MFGERSRDSKEARDAHDDYKPEVDNCEPPIDQGKSDPTLEKWVEGIQKDIKNKSTEDKTKLPSETKAE